jgi:uncharacterized protein with PQ loop repeat
VIETIGWISGAMLALCGLPEAVLAYRRKNSLLSYPFLLMWYIGEWGLFFYSLAKNKEVDLLPLLFNYGLNIVFISIILFYKMRYTYELQKSSRST